jgi:hypothetical protein
MTLPDTLHKGCEPFHGPAFRAGCGPDIEDDIFFWEVDGQLPGKGYIPSDFLRISTQISRKIQILMCHVFCGIILGNPLEREQPGKLFAPLPVETDPPVAA